LLVAAAAITIGVICGWLLFGSPLFAVQRVQVQGLHRVPLADVRAVAEQDVGRSMALTSTQAVAERVVQVPLVLSARVDRRWPSTLVVTVVEREPIAAVAVSGATGSAGVAGATGSARGGVALMDADGVVVETVGTGAVPAGLPLLDVDVRKAGAASLRAAREVSDAIPAQLRPGVKTVTATSPDAVSFVLADGTRVLWGSAQDGPAKAATLLAVHPKPLSRPVTIDVSAPDAPALTSRN
jgi:cell division protein FtsQ